MNKYSPKFDDLRARVLDTETLLHFLRDRENLQTLMDHGCPVDTVGAIIDGAYNAISEAGGLSEALLKARDEDFLSEYKEAATEAINHAKKFRIADFQDDGRTAETGDTLSKETREGAPVALTLDKTANDELEKIGSASAVVSELMQRILLERTLQGCPDWMDSDYTLGGLVQVSEILAGRVCDLSARMEQGGRYHE